MDGIASTLQLHRRQAIARKPRLSEAQYQAIKADLLPILLEHVGAENAITGKELAKALGHKDDRRIRMAIRRLIHEGYNIVACTEKPGGFFMARTVEECDAYVADLKSRIVEDIDRWRDVKRNKKRCFEQLYQLRLPLALPLAA